MWKGLTKLANYPTCTENPHKVAQLSYLYWKSWSQYLRIKSRQASDKIAAHIAGNHSDGCLVEDKSRTDGWHGSPPAVASAGFPRIMGGIGLIAIESIKILWNQLVPIEWKFKSRCTSFFSAPCTLHQSYCCQLCLYIVSGHYIVKCASLGKNTHCIKV